MEITGSIAPAEGRESSDIVRGLFFCAVVPTSERTPWSNVSYVVWSATAYAEVSEWWIMDNRATPKQVPEPEMGISWARCELALSMIWKVFVKGAREVLGDGQGWSGCPKCVLGVNVGGVVVKTPRWRSRVFQVRGGVAAIREMSASPGSFLMRSV